MNTEFEQIELGTALGGLTAISERLPNLPAVYTFVRSVVPPPVHDPQKFRETVKAVITEKTAPDHEAAAGPLHRVVLQSFSQLSSTKEDTLLRLSESQAFRELVQNIFMKAAHLQAPLYVGKARDLQERFRQHIKPMSPLSIRFREVGIALEKCRLVYTVLDSSSTVESDEALFLIEELLSRLLRPGFVLRIG